MMHASAGDACTADHLLHQLAMHMQVLIIAAKGAERVQMQSDNSFACIQVGTHLLCNRCGNCLSFQQLMLEQTPLLFSYRLISGLCVEWDWQVGMSSFNRKQAIDVKVCKASLSGARENLLYFISSSLCLLCAA